MGKKRFDLLHVMTMILQEREFSCKVDLHRSNFLAFDGKKR